MESNTPDHSSRGHAPFSPSSLKYVAGCSGYEGRSGTNAAAEKGTRIHEALEVRDPSALHDEDEVMIYEAIVKQEDEYTKNYAKGQEYKEENEILLDVDLDSTNTWGTCDRLLTFGNKAILADYKTGVSEIDPPRSNWQARAYTVGAFQKYPELDEITFVFYIPVRNEVLEGTFTREELPLLVKQLADVIRNGEKVRPQWDGGFPEADALSPSVNCRFCKHEEYCPSLGGLAVEIVQRISGDNLPKENIEDPNDPKTVEHLYIVAKVVENWAKRVKEKAVALAKDGMEFQNLKLKSMGATRKCTDNIKLVEIAKEYDLEQEDLLNLISIPLKKVANAVGDNAPKGEKGEKSRSFLDAVENNGIIETSEERFTLS